MELADSYFVEPVSMLLAKLSERKSYWTLKIQTTWPLESLSPTCIGLWQPLSWGVRTNFPYVMRIL